MNKELWLWGPRFASQLTHALAELNEPRHHLAVDGGAHVRDHLNEELIESWWALGDGDSAPAELLNKVYEQDKDQSDLALALSYNLAAAAKIRAIGFSDGRPDHYILGLGRFYYHVKNISEQIRLDQNWLILRQGKWKGTLTPSTCSLIALEPCRLSLQGPWKWPLKHREVIPFDDLLLSNECGSGELIIHSDRPIILWSEMPITNWWESIK